MENYTMKKEAIAAIVKLNDKIFEQENKVDNLQHAVSSVRYYLAADKSEQRVLELRGAMQNLKAASQKLEELRQQLATLVDDVFNENNWE